MTSDQNCLHALHMCFPYFWLLNSYTALKGVFAIIIIIIIRVRKKIIIIIVVIIIFILLNIPREL